MMLDLYARLNVMLGLLSVRSVSSLEGDNLDIPIALISSHLIVLVLKNVKLGYFISFAFHLNKLLVVGPVSHYSPVRTPLSVTPSVQLVVYSRPGCTEWDSTCLFFLHPMVKYTFHINCHRSRKSASPKPLVGSTNSKLCILCLICVI